MSSVSFRPRAVGSFMALSWALAVSAFVTGCSRTEPPVTAKAEPAKSATPAAPSAGTVAPEAAKSGDLKPGADAAKSGPPVPGGAPGAEKGLPPGASKRSSGDMDRARQAAAEQIPVETAPITRGPISAFLSFNSTLETESIVDIYPQTSGQVEGLLVEEGKIVKEGDPLLKIEDRELRLDVEENSANFEQIEKNFARNKDLFERNLINKQEHETQAYQREQARLRLERSKIRLAYATVRAPFDGVISGREVQVGARVGTGTKLFSMVKLDDIVARVFVPGRYLPVVAVDQPAVVTSEFLPDRSFKGWVKRISPVIDPKSGTFKVTVGVRGEKPTDLPPGLFVGVRVITDTRPDAILIPKRAVIYEGGERFVFTVVGGRALKKKVPVGFEDPTHVEALSGFEVGTQVIVLGQSGLKDGAMVRPVNAPKVVPTAAPQAAANPAPTSPKAKEDKS